jgi:hypothetical protein
VRSATIDGNYLKVNTGGVDANLTIPFAKHSHYENIGGNSSDTHDSVLKSYFENNYETIPRNKLIGLYSGAYGNGSYYMGYYLSGYNDKPYGGFFVAHYGNPYYVGI